MLCATRPNPSLRLLMSRGLRLDQYALGRALLDCSAQRLLLPAQQLHALIIKSRFDGNAFVAAGLIDVYSKCRMVSAAATLFDAVPQADRHRNSVLWTVMVAGFERNGDPIGAVRFFRDMQSAGVPPSQFTFPTVLAACAATAALEFGSQVHGCVVRSGFENNAFVRGALVDMYGKCGELVDARKILETWQSSYENNDDVVAWNSLLGGCVRCGRWSEALETFVKMRRRGIDADEFAYPSALNSLASLGSAAEGRAIHCLISKSGFAEGYVHVGNALIDMYAKCGDLQSAQDVFDRMGEKDVVTWTALLTGCARRGLHVEGLRLFGQMRAAGVDADYVITAGVLSCCGELTALALGRQVHAVNLRRGFDLYISVGNAMVTMYAKAGCIQEARQAFDEMPNRDAVTWTALIVGYAQNGRGRESLRLYDRMVRSGAKPDYITFIGVLFACSHAGLEADARHYLESMERAHGVTPGPEHYACVVDLLGRLGKLSEAAELLDRPGFRPDAAVWKALLAACRAHGQAGWLAERAAEALYQASPDDAVPYVLLANAYSSAGRWEDARKVRTLMRSRGVRKEAGWSWMEVGGVVHAFRAADRDHARATELYAKADEMLRRIGEEECYVVDVGWSLHGEEAELALHSEKLAVAFGLLSLPEEAPIRVFKNLRMCGDCHRALKLVAKVYGREMVVRDPNCFHHFGVGGECSCGDFW